jgi:HSP20 family protein
MSLVRYEPLGTLRRFQDEVNRLLRDDVGFGYDGGLGADRSSVATSAWTPAVDIREEAERYLISADVPGVDPKDIDITMENGVLTIKGERRSEAKSDSDGFRRVERAFGSFYRRFSLPDTADAEAISASSNQGVLEVSIPKKQALQPRRIEVS